MKNINDIFCQYQNPPQMGKGGGPLPQKNLVPLKKNKNLRIWGEFNYDFKFRTQGESLYQTSNLNYS